MQARYEKVGWTDKERRTGKECELGDVQMFMGEIRRYVAITELDETVLNRLINRILIGEPKKVVCPCK